MNPMERLLQDDLDRLVDRLAATTREGLLSDCADHRPELIERLNAAEARLSGLRQDLLGGYAAWRRALAEATDLWAMAELIAEPTPAASRRAA